MVSDWGTFHWLTDVHECNYLVYMQSHRTIRWFDIKEEDGLDFFYKKDLKKGKRLRLLFLYKVFYLLWRFFCLLASIALFIIPRKRANRTGNRIFFMVGFLSSMYLGSRRGSGLTHSASRVRFGRYCWPRLDMGRFSDGSCSRINYKGKSRPIQYDGFLIKSAKILTG